MQEKLSILAFSGSTRKDSFNHKLVRVAGKGAENRGLTVTVIRLSDFPMPLYDGDYEQENGIPDSVKSLKALMNSHQGLLIASPEYNSSLTAVLKNTIDWLSRAQEGEAPLQCFKGKVISLMSTSPGALGGIRGLVHVRSILGNLGCIVLPDQVAVPTAHKVFGDNGDIQDQKLKERVEDLGVKLADTLLKLHV